MDHQDKIGKGWRRYESRDILSGNLIGIEVVPENDLHDHIGSENCPCIPLYIARVNESCCMTLIHNSFDGREEGERNERGN